MTTEELENEKDHSKFLEKLLATLYGIGWENLTLYEAKKWHEANWKSSDPKMKTYDELCHDPNVSPIERETALLKEYNEALKEIERLREALRTFRRAFIIAVGDKSPFAKEALRIAEQALKEVN